MTLISFFDEDPLDNIGDILYLLPKRCVFLGDDKLMKKRKRALMEQFLRKRGMDTKIVFRSLPRGDIDGALELLRKLISEYPDSIFDVTGGTELHLAAAGIVSGMYDIPLYQRNGKSGKILWQYGCALESQPASVSVSEVIALHSGAIIHDNAFCRPTLTPALRRDIFRLWDIAKEFPARWNNTCTALGALAVRNETNDALQIVARGQLDMDIFYQADMPMLADLVSEGFITNLDYPQGGISFCFRDEDIRMIFTKAGTLLELYTYLAVEWADDRAVSVCLDWDGIDADKPGVQTRNEVDVMMTYGMLPVCISCKNGEFDKTALYELDTVSKHFMGRYGKKVLVASYVGQIEDTVKTLEQRARDMNIIPIFQVHQMTFEEFSQKLKSKLIGT